MLNITAVLMLTDDQIARLKERGKPAIRSQMQELPGAWKDGNRRYRYWAPILYLANDRHERWHFGWDQSVYGVGLHPAGWSDGYNESPHWRHIARPRPGYNAALAAADEVDEVLAA